MSIFSKVLEAADATLDSYIAKAKTTTSPTKEEYEERKSTVELAYPDEQQYGYKEKTSLVGSGVLKNMARKDSLITAIINTRLSQASPYLKEQRDRYSPGWNVFPVEPADLSPDDKLSLADPSLEEEAFDQLKFDMEKKRLSIKEAQDKEIVNIKTFIKHCGMPPEESDTTYKRWDFEKFALTVIKDRLIYNYGAVELIPTKDGDKLHHFYPVSSGTIRYVSITSSEQYVKMLAPIMDDKLKLKKRFDSTKPFRYVQVVRGKIMAAFTEDELIFEAAQPTVDPEDNGYSIGELETLMQIVTAHLYAEAHNRNFFTQGIGTKGILHIKGDNISRAQLEAFKRQWFNQVVNTRNAFRPPIIGMAEDVKWVPLAQTNKEMEFEQWMNYLIKMTCAIYQIDPAEINFDISKTQSSTLNEGNNEEKLKASKDKGLRPLLDYIENLMNNHILRYWNPKLADKYKFKFVGFQAESKQQEIDRLQKETQVWKSLNEARIEMGYPPIENGDIVLNATYTQYLAQKQQADQAAQGLGPDGQPTGGQDDGTPGDGTEGLGDNQPVPNDNADQPSDLDSFATQLEQAVNESGDAVDGEKKQDEKDQKEQDKKDKEKSKKKDAVKKSEEPLIVEYYYPTGKKSDEE